MSKEFYFKHFSLAYEHSSNSPIDRTQSGDTTSDQSGPGRDGNEEVLRIPITGTPSSDCLVSYQDICYVEGLTPL